MVILHTVIPLFLSTMSCRIVAKALEVLLPQEFAETIIEESRVYALLVLDVDVNKGLRVHTLKTDASRTEPDINTAP